MFTLRRHQGRLGEVAPVLRRFLDSQPEASTWRPGLAILHCELGARDEARDAFERLAVGDFAGLPHDAIRIASLAYLAEVCAWLEDATRAAVLYELLVPYAGRNIVFGAHTASFGSADRLLGMLAATRRRWEAAERHFEAALAFDARTGGRPWLARSRVEYASMRLRRGEHGDRDRALELLAAATEAAGTLGMPGLGKIAVELQRRAGGEAQEAPPPGAGAPAPPTAGLSRRELQVLSLMAAGKTNQQIADAIFRSPNTVANHVRSILAKTGAANRAEAAAFAVRHGLVPPG